MAVNPPVDLVVVTGEEALRRRSDIEAAAAGRPVVFRPDRAAAEDVLGRAEVLAGPVDEDVLRAAPRLRWVHSWLAGADAALVPALVDGDVVLTSSTGNGAVPLAEHSILLMLMLDREVPRWVRAQAEHRWDRYPHGELNGQTLGIVGLGHSGADLALKAHAFHMRVLGLRRRPERSVEHVERVYGPDQLHAFLAECDYVVVTVPSTPATRGMFGPAEFRAMKPTARWICISRGGVADDTALLDALRSGEIAAAGLDAHGVEPLPPQSPFWDLPNVVLTPHNGATTSQTQHRGVDLFVDNLSRYLRGEPLVNVVDKRAGY